MYIDELIKLSFEEDAVANDVTSLACIPAEQNGVGQIVLKQDGVIAGLSFLPKMFPGCSTELLAADGERYQKGAVLARVTGSARMLLSAERTALNLLQHLSGIATLTAKCVALAGSCKILDTRKTLLGYRDLQKYAVRCGGGTNHRSNLADKILIKNNHLALVGCLKTAIARAKESGLKVEVEIGSFDDLPIAMEADAILLDNMSPETIKRCVEHVNKRVFLEASGGITMDTLAAYAATGVDAISIGALTHSAPALDIAFRIK